VIEIVNAEYEHSHNDMELSFDFEVKNKSIRFLVGSLLKLK